MPSKHLADESLLRVHVIKGASVAPLASALLHFMNQGVAGSHMSYLLAL